MKLRTRTMVFFFPLFILNIIIILFFVNMNFQSLIEENTKEKSGLLANQVKILENQLQTKALATATAIATNQGIIDAYRMPTPEEKHQAIIPVADEIAKALAVSMKSDNARIHFHQAPARSLYRTWTDKWNDDLSTFRFTVNQVISQGTPIMGIELGKGGMVIRGVHPVRADGKTLGSVEMYFQPQDVLKMMQMDSGKTGMVLLAGRAALEKILFKEDLATYYNQGEIGDQMISFISDDWILPEKMIFPELLEESAQTGESLFDQVGNFTVNYIPINDWQGTRVGFYVLVQDISQEIQSQMLIIRNLSVLLFLINVIILASLLFLIIKYIVRPIKRLDTAVEILSKGSGDLSHRIPVKRKDELGDIAGNFNLFIEKLSEIIRQTRNASLQSEMSIDELSSVSSETMAATHQIMDASRKSSESIENTGQEMRNSGEYTTIISSKLADFQRSIEQLSAIVEQSTAGLTEMMASIDSINKVVQDREQMMVKLVELSEDGENTIVETNEQIGSIRGAVTQIEEFTTMINSIASQTNLLSMNAAIEAAHAGEAGKGFAVVAEEIRKLAETSAEESKRITDAINGITQTIANTEESGETSKQAFLNIAETVKNVADGLHGIAISVNELSAGSSEIMTAITEVRDVTLLVKDSSMEIQNQQENLREVVDKSVIAMSKMQEMGSEMSNSSSEIEFFMNHLLSVVEKLTKNTETMKKEIHKFQLEEDK